MPQGWEEAHAFTGRVHGPVRSELSARPLSHWATLNPAFADALRALLTYDGFLPAAIDGALVSPLAYGAYASSGARPSRYRRRCGAHTAIVSRVFFNP